MMVYDGLILPRDSAKAHWYAVEAVCKYGASASAAMVNIW